MNSEFPWKHDPHRCGSAPFVPQVLADGTQNSCGSYEYTFDSEGRNEYLANYPDDIRIQDYACAGGDCNDFKQLDLVRPIVENNEGCCKGLNYRIQNNDAQPSTMEGFCSPMANERFLMLVMWFILIAVFLKVVCLKCAGCK